MPAKRVTSPFGSILSIAAHVHSHCVTNKLPLASKARPRGPWKGASSAATGYDAAVVAATFADGLGDAGTAAVAEGAAEPIEYAPGTWGPTSADVTPPGGWVDPV